MAEEFPKNYIGIRDRYQEYSSILGDLGKVVRDSGPIEHKNTHLVQLAASAAIRSEGAVHSHTKRALEAGASPEEIYQALLLVTSIIGFPNVAAAISWADDVIQK